MREITEGGPSTEPAFSVSTDHPAGTAVNGPGVWEELGSALQVPPSGTNIWDSIAAHADPASWQPLLDSDVEVATLDWAKTGPSALVARGSTVFGLDACEVELLPLLDGSRSVAELIALRLEESGKLNPSAVVGLVAMLRTSGFLKDKPPDVDGALDSGARAALADHDPADRPDALGGMGRRGPSRPFPLHPRAETRRQYLGGGSRKRCGARRTRGVRARRFITPFSPHHPVGGLGISAPHVLEPRRRLRPRAGPRNGDRS